MEKETELMSMETKRDVMMSQYNELCDRIVEICKDYDPAVAVAALGCIVGASIKQMSKDHNDALDNVRIFTETFVDDIDQHFAH